MISKTKLKEIIGYKQQKACDEAGFFVVEGIKMAEEALANNANIVIVCAVKDWLEKHQNMLPDATCYEIDDNELKKISSLQTPNEVWMLIQRKTSINILSYPGITLLLDHLQDPGNMGTIMRTADWYGIRHIVCSSDTVSCYNPKVVQATMGAIFRTTVEYVSLPEWIDKYKNPVYGAVLNGTDIRNIAFEPTAALVIGNESKGISDNVASKLTQRITIPNIGGTCESLNAANAATAILTWIILH